MEIIKVLILFVLYAFIYAIGLIVSRNDNELGNAIMIATTLLFIIAFCILIGFW